MFEDNENTRSVLHGTLLKVAKARSEHCQEISDRRLALLVHFSHEIQ